MGSLVIDKKTVSHYYDGTVEYWHGRYTTQDGDEEEYIASTQQAILDYFSQRMIEHRQRLARETMH